jgi:DNA-directed RNA polymerase specialized sigma24 family protein
VIDRTSRTFEEFTAARYPALVRSAFLLVGDSGHAEDLVQSALYRTFLAWERLRAPEAAEAYTRKTMIRLAARWARRAGAVRSRMGTSSVTRWRIPQPRRRKGRWMPERRWLGCPTRNGPCWS